MTFRPYPTYKNSEAEWLGAVPAHWQLLSLARVTVEKCDGPFGSGLKSEHYSDEGVRVVRLQNIERGGSMVQMLRLLTSNTMELRWAAPMM